MSANTRAHILGKTEHYAAHGTNASVVVKTIYADPMRSDSNAKKHTTLALRKGRADEGEAVQLEITVETIGKVRSTRKDASVSFDQATWDFIVEFVRKDRNL